MIEVAVIFADGMEEIEALTPVDVLRRAGALVTTYSVNEIMVKGSHGIEIKADKLIDEIDDIPSAVIVPGGMPGALNISNHSKAIFLIKEIYRKGGLVSAICASPAVVLAKTGVTDGKHVTCYPANDFIKALDKANYLAEEVVKDQNVITANGPKSAMNFALEICKTLNIEPKF